MKKNIKNNPDESLEHLADKKRKDVLKEEAVTSPGKMAVKNFFSNKLGVIGLLGFLAITLVVFIGSSFLDYDP